MHRISYILQVRNENDRRQFDVNFEIRNRIDKRTHVIMSYLKNIFKEMDISFQFL